LWGISNDTSIDMGWATVRNIFGYRRIDVVEKIDSAAMGPINIDFAPGVSIPLTVFNAGATTARSYLSDELQLFGTAFDDRLDWITGAYYNKDKATDPMGSTFTAFAFGTAPGVPAAGVPITSSITNRNTALFAQTGLDISEWTVEGLKVTAGLRYSWDNVSACGGSNPAGTGYMTTGECEAIAKTGNPTDGVGIVKNSGEAPSWTIGVDWQITPDTLLYAVTRRGYRGVNVNTPAFESPYTTGQSNACYNAVANSTACPNLLSFQKTEKETLTDYEIGVKNDWRAGDVKGRANLAAFVSKYKNALQFLNAQQDFNLPPTTPDTPTNGSVGANIADLDIWGVETDFTVVPVPSLTLTLSAAYTHQEVAKFKLSPTSGYNMSKDDVTLPSPELTATFGFNWVLPVQPLDGELALNGDYYYTDDFSGQAGENLPGYEVANFRLTWSDIAHSGLTVASYVKNAFDKKYYSGPDVLLQSFPVGVVIAGDPRTWGVEATYRF
jgi:iron complex outermembrane receptor protein